MAGYSETPQVRKLGIKPGQRVALDGAPQGWELDGHGLSSYTDDDADRMDVIIGFFRAAEELAARLPGLAERVFPSGALWVAWPRRAGGHTSDITDNVVRAAALPLGIVDVKVAAIDQDWSGLRFVWRTERRGARDTKGVS